jgi:hypothetical protein
MALLLKDRVDIVFICRLNISSSWPFNTVIERDKIPHHLNELKSEYLYVLN